MISAQIYEVQSTACHNEHGFKIIYTRFLSNVVDYGMIFCKRKLKNANQVFFYVGCTGEKLCFTISIYVTPYFAFVFMLFK